MSTDRLFPTSSLLKVHARKVGTKKIHIRQREKEHKVKTKSKIVVALAGLLALGTAALVVRAQDNGVSPHGNGPNGPLTHGHRPPAPAIVIALDANHDGVIDVDEIANVPAALRTLDKNSDGKLTPDEFMGPRPHLRPPPGDGAGPNNGGAPPADKNAPAGPPTEQQ